ASVPVGPMKIALAAAVLGAVGLLGSGYNRKSMPSTAETLATGSVAGMLNGAFGIVAPPVIVFFFASPAGATITRASLLAFFIGTDIMGLSFLAREGLITSESLYRFLFLAVPLFAGQWLGVRCFKSTDPAKFRLWVLRLLVLLALLTGIQGCLSLTA